MHTLRTACLVLGTFSFILLVLAFTRIPFDAHRWLGTAGGTCTAAPELIVVLGGSGMPSGPELMRCHLASEGVRTTPMASILLLLPPDTILAAAMVAELVTKGVPEGQISSLCKGKNTREQALDLRTERPDLLTRPITLVTAPENMYRSLLTFRKVGFSSICGLPAFDHALFDDLRYAHQAIGGKTYVPDVSGNLDLRYNFWNRIKLEITCLREFSALAYYRLNGWI